MFKNIDEIISEINNKKSVKFKIKVTANSKSETIDFCEEFYFDGDNIPINIQNKFKEKQNSYISNELPSKKCTNIEKNDKDIKLRDPRKRLNEKKKRDIFYYDIDNLDEEEFFEKEFDTNYGNTKKIKIHIKKCSQQCLQMKKGSKELYLLP